MVGEHPRAFNVTINDLVVTACGLVTWVATNIMANVARVSTRSLTSLFSYGAPKWTKISTIDGPRSLLDDRSENGRGLTWLMIKCGWTCVSSSVAMIDVDVLTLDRCLEHWYVNIDLASSTISWFDHSLTVFLKSSLDSMPPQWWHRGYSLWLWLLTHVY